MQRGTEMQKILVIDDDALIRNMVSSSLMKAGHEVECAENGVDGLRKAQENPPELVITDMLMPDMEGIETIMEMRSKNPNIGIIAMSGGGSTGNMDFLEMASRLGAQHVLKKPFKPSVLLDLVDKMKN
jgi:CheY-like chemotaxis protein